MATRQYIGARYVPVFADPVEWDNTRTYEHLMMVQHLGETYMSQQAVPIGIDLPDVEHGSESNDYWVHMSNWNAQVESYREEVLRYIGDVETYNDRISGLENELPSTSFDSVNTVSAAIDAINDKIGGSYTSESTVDDAIDAINDKIGGSYTSENTVKDDINDVELRSCPNKVVFTPVKYVTNTGINSACAFAKTVNDKVIMFDTGVDNSYTLIKDSLDSNNVTHIDCIVISHYHGDHIGNVVSMISDGYIDSDTVFYLPASTTLFPYTEPTYVAMMNAITALNCTKVYPTNGQTVEIDSAKLEFYNCSASDMAWMESNAPDYNNCSMICYLQFDENTFAFLGDIEYPNAQDYIVEQGYIKPHRVLAMPHHGYNTTMSSCLFIESNPEYIIAQTTAVGFNVDQTFFKNPFIYGKNKNDVSVYMTGLGEVTFTCDDSGLNVYSEGERVSSIYNYSITSSDPDIMPTIHVNQNTGSDTNNGGSETSAFKTIYRAISQASVFNCPVTIMFDADYIEEINVLFNNFVNGIRLARKNSSVEVKFYTLNIFNSNMVIDVPIEVTSTQEQAVLIMDNSRVFCNNDTCPLTLSGDFSALTNINYSLIWVVNSFMRYNKIVFSGITNTNLTYGSLLYSTQNAQINVTTVNVSPNSIKYLSYPQPGCWNQIESAPDTDNYTAVLHIYSTGAASGVGKHNPFA